MTKEEKFVAYILRFYIQHNGIMPEPNRIMRDMGIRTRQMLNYYRSKAVERGIFTNTEKGKYNLSSKTKKYLKDHDFVLDVCQSMD